MDEEGKQEAYPLSWWQLVLFFLLFLVLVFTDKWVSKVGVFLGSML